MKRGGKASASAAKNGSRRRTGVGCDNRPAMRPHLAFATNTALQPAPDLLRVLVVSKAPLMRAGLITMLGAYRDLDLTEAGPAEVLLGDEPMPDAGAPALILVRDAAAAAAALAGGARGVLPRNAAPRRMHAALHA